MFPSSTKREMRQFHVVVVQRQQRNVQESVMQVQSCCFACLNLSLFCRSRCRRRLRVVNSLLSIETKQPLITILQVLPSNIGLTLLNEGKSKTRTLTSFFASDSTFTNQFYRWLGNPWRRSPQGSTDRIRFLRDSVQRDMAWYAWFFNTATGPWIRLRSIAPCPTGAAPWKRRTFSLFAP